MTPPPTILHGDAIEKMREAFAFITEMNVAALHLGMSLPAYLDDLEAHAAN